MAVMTTITILHDKETAQDVIQMLKTYNSAKIKMVNQVEILLAGLVSGARHGVVDLQIPGDASVIATQTLTCGTVVATNTCVVGGVTFTAVASAPVGPQFLAGSPALASADLVRAINATASLGGVVRAESAVTLGVVNLISIYPGPIGNLVTSVGGTNITAGGATLVGGTYASNQFRYGI